MILTPLRQHASTLAEALFGIGGQNLELLDVISYLKLASGIRALDFNTTDFDPYPAMCSGAAEFDERSDALCGILAHRLTMFLFIWASLEAFKNRVTFQTVPKEQGHKARYIDSLCYYLSSRCLPPYPYGYGNVLRTFKKCSSSQKITGGSPSFSKLPTWLKTSAEGIYHVYEVRNSFAHGDFSVPFPDGDPLKHPDVIHVTLAARLVLLTLQMMALCLYDNAETVDMPTLLRFDNSPNSLTVGKVFRELHNPDFADLNRNDE